MSRISLFVAVLTIVCVTTKGEILCYSCISQGEGDQACIHNPAEVVSVNPVIKCKYKYCTVRRYEYAADPGSIQTFFRGCEDEPLPNGENPAEDTIVWAQSCNFADLCNVGDGLTEITPDNVGTGGGGSGNVIIVPASGASRLHFGEISFVLTFLLTAFFCIRQPIHRF